jgi:hypothetical protein
MEDESLKKWLSLRQNQDWGSGVTYPAIWRCDHISHWRCGMSCGRFAHISSLDEFYTYIFVQECRKYIVDGRLNITVHFII